MRTIKKRSVASQQWFALADAKSIRLLRCSLTRQGTHHVDQISTLENTFPEQEHARPMTGAGETHNIEHAERRFGGEIIAWLQTQLNNYQFEQLTVFAPARMLGVLRSVPMGSLKGCIEELKGDLMRLNAGQLAAHPMIQKMMTPELVDVGAAPASNSTIQTAEASATDSAPPEGRCTAAS